MRTARPTTVLILAIATAFATASAEQAAIAQVPATAYLFSFFNIQSLA